MRSGQHNVAKTKHGYTCTHVDTQKDQVRDKHAHTLAFECTNASTHGGTNVSFCLTLPFVVDRRYASCGTKIAGKNDVTHWVGARCRVWAQMGWSLTIGHNLWKKCLRHSHPKIMDGKLFVCFVQTDSYVLSVLCSWSVQRKWFSQGCTESKKLLIINSSAFTLIRHH